MTTKTKEELGNCVLVVLAILFVVWFFVDGFSLLLFGMTIFAIYWFLFDLCAIFKNIKKGEIFYTFISILGLIGSVLFLCIFSKEIIFDGILSPISHLLRTLGIDTPQPFEDLYIWFGRFFGVFH